MRWHAELLIEAALLLILWRKHAPLWFSILIGVDFIAGALQLLPYRFGLRAHSRLIWETGVVLAGPLVCMSLIEAASLPAGRLRFWHVRILAAWIAGLLTLLTLQTQPSMVLLLNGPLLIFNGVCFAGWAALFLAE